MGKKTGETFFFSKFLQSKEKSSTASQEQDSLLAEMVLLLQLDKGKHLLLHSILVLVLKSASNKLWIKI